MAGFNNKFFSLKGEKERVSNAGKYLQLATSKMSFGIIKGPEENKSYVPTSTVSRAAQMLANNPGKVAFVGGTAVNAVKFAPQLNTLAKSGASRAASGARKVKGLVVGNASKATGIVKTANDLRSSRTAVGPTGSTAMPGIIQQPRSSMVRAREPSPGLLSSPQGTAGILDTASSLTGVTSRTGGGSVRRRTSARSHTRKTRSSTSGAPTPRRRGARRTSRPRRSGRKTRRASRRKTTRRKSSKRRYGTAKQYARPGGKNVKYTKNGQPYIILASGKARFIKGRRKKR